MPPFVSICIPVFNGEKHLKECLNSALLQSYKNIEIVIVDDGSTDGSREIINEYALKNGRIKAFYNSQNKGLTENWNKCLESSSGEWIKYIFQDDYLSPRCVEEMLIDSESKVPLIVCRRTFVLKDNAEDKTRNYYKHEVLTFEKLGITAQKNLITPAMISNFSCRNIGMNFIGEPTSILFRKEIVSDIGMFNSDLQQICDLEFALRIASNFGLIYINEPLTFFRVHELSATTKNLENKNYTLLHLDPVILARQMLFDLQFANLRRQLSIINKIKLNLFFSLRVYEAFKSACDNKEYLRLFENMANKFPEVQKHKNPGIFMRMILMLVLLKREFKKIFSY